MAQNNTQQYHLRKRNTSQLGTNAGTEPSSSSKQFHPLSDIHLDQPVGSKGETDNSPGSNSASESDPESVNSTSTPKGVQKESQIPVIKMEDFEIVDMNDKLNLLMVAINKVNTSFHLKLDALNGENKSDSTEIKTQMQNFVSIMEELQERVDDLESKVLPDDVISRIKRLEEENTALRDELAVVKGFMQVQDKKINVNQRKLIDLTMRSMSANIVVSGITGNMEDETLEECKKKVLKLLQEDMDMDIQAQDVQVAHRLGKKLNAKPRPVVVKCSPHLRSNVFKHTKKLKDLLNSNGEKYYINPQLPELLATEKRERDDLLRTVKQQNEAIPEEEKHKRIPVQIKNKVLYINNIAQKTHIHPPLVKDIFNMDAKTYEAMDQLQVVHSTPIKEKASVF